MLEAIVAFVLYVTIASTNAGAFWAAFVLMILSIVDCVFLFSRQTTGSTIMGVITVILSVLNVIFTISIGPTYF